MAKVYCKYCGENRLDIRSLTSGLCRKNPDGEHHVPYDSDEKDRYFCKYCGTSRLDIPTLTSAHCRNNPHSDYHEPER